MSAAIHATHGDITGHAHGPADDGDIEDLCFGEEAHATIEVAERVDVEIRGVIGDVDADLAGREHVGNAVDFGGHADGRQGDLEPGGGDKVVEASETTIEAEHEWVHDEHWDEEDDGPGIGDEEEEETEEGDFLLLIEALFGRAGVTIGEIGLRSRAAARRVGAGGCQWGGGTAAGEGGEARTGDAAWAIVE